MNQSATSRQRRQRRQRQRSIKAEKSLSTTYLVWLAGGLCGAHRYYLGKMRSGHIMMALSLMVTLSWGFVLKNMTQDTLATLDTTGLPGGSWFGLINLLTLVFLGDVHFSDFVVSASTRMLIKAGQLSLVVLILWWVWDGVRLKKLFQSKN